MKLHYLQTGKGNTTLVFLHYFGGAGNTWQEVISYLQNEFHCIAIDLLGFGKSPAPNKQISVESSANAVTDFLQNMNLSNYILIGHSMGGKIALNVAAKQPDNLQSLVLIAPSPPTPEPMKKGEREDMDNAFGKKEAVEKLVRSATAHPLPEEVSNKEVSNNLETSETGWHSWPRLGSQEDISGNMKDIQVPVAIICGESDKKFPKDFLQKEFSNYFSSFTVDEIPNAGHLLPVEAPEEVANAIRRIVL